jgi:hypothetical protein
MDYNFGQSILLAQSSCTIIIGSKHVTICHMASPSFEKKLHVKYFFSHRSHKAKLRFIGLQCPVSCMFVIHFFEGFCNMIVRKTKWGCEQGREPNIKVNFGEGFQQWLEV